MTQPIPFTWTTPALLAGQKSVIRQDWLEEEVADFQAGRFAWACDYLQQAGGAPIAVIRFTSDPVREPTSQLTDHDYEEEGFAFLERLSFPVPEHVYPLREFFHLWKSIDIPLWVLRFEVVELTPEGRSMAERLFKHTRIMA